MSGIDHLPLVLLGFRVFPERILLSLPLKLFLVLPWFYPESLDGSELPSSQHHRRVQSVLKNNFTVLPHHSAVSTLKPDQIPSSLSSCSHVFIRESPLSPLDRGLRWVPSLTLCLRIGLNHFL